MNKQEIFNMIVKKARIQNKKSMNGSSCVYRGVEGSCCFIGFLIPDKKYRFEMEDVAASHLPRQFPELMEDIFPDDLYEEDAERFVDGLQVIHDKITIDEWEERFAMFAEKWEMEMPE